MALVASGHTGTFRKPALPGEFVKTFTKASLFVPIASNWPTYASQNATGTTNLEVIHIHLCNSLYSEPISSSARPVVYKHSPISRRFLSTRRPPTGEIFLPAGQAAAPSVKPGLAALGGIPIRDGHFGGRKLGVGIRSWVPWAMRAGPLGPPLGGTRTPTRRAQRSRPTPNRAGACFSGIRSFGVWTFSVWTFSPLNAPPRRPAARAAGAAA